MPATTFAELFGAIFPLTAETELGVVYGPTGAEFTGTAVFDAGTAVFPAAAEVLSPIQFGPTGADFTGTVILPNVASVEEGVLFGPSSSLEGTLVPTGGLTPGQRQEIVDEVVAGVTLVGNRVVNAAAGTYIFTRGDTWTQRFDMTAVSGARVVVSLKYKTCDVDGAEALLADSTTGLLILNGSATGVTAADATVDIQPTYVDFTLSSKASILIGGATYQLSVKQLAPGDDVTWERDGVAEVKDYGIALISA